MGGAGVGKEVNLTEVPPPPPTDAEEAGANQEEGRSCGQHSGHLRTGESGTASKVRGRGVTHKGTRG